MTTPARPPAWTWDETVLAYDLYLRDYANPLRYPDGTHQAVQDLSRVLRALPHHPAAVRSDPRFRNANSVARKIQNLMWQATGETSGSANGSAMDVRVVRELQDRDDVHGLARKIRADGGVAGSPGTPEAPPVSTSSQPTLEEYRRAALGDDNALEKEVLSKRRTEQAFLRSYLLGGAAQGVCAFCGGTYPSGLLIAAHIKRRADLTDEEKMQFDAVAVLACALGCDALFEAGYIAVAANGTILATDTTVPDDLRQALERLEGAACLAFSSARAPYFASHREHRLKRN